MAFTRSFEARRAPSPCACAVTPALQLAALFLAAALFLPGRPAGAADLPPGSYPCTEATVSAGYGSFILLKHVDHLQTSPSAVPPSSGALARIDLLPPPPYSISNAVVSGPGPFLANLARQSDGSSTWSEAGTEAAITARIPPGTGTTSFLLSVTNGETFIGFFPFTLEAATPPIPQIVNFDAAQAIQSQEAFTVLWNGWIGSTTNDRMNLTIVDSSGQVVVSAATDCSGDRILPPAATGFTLAPGKLSAGQTYTGYLTFGAALSSGRDESTLIEALVFTTRTTSFTLKTAVPTSGNGSPAKFLNPRVVGTNLVFRLSGAAGDVQRIDSTANFVAWVRETDVTLPPAGTLDVTIPITPGALPRFYRAVAIGGNGSTGDPGTLAITLVGPHDFEIRVIGTPGVTYNIEMTGDGHSWLQVATAAIPATGAPVTVRLTLFAGQNFALFRAVIPTTLPPKPLLAPRLVIALQNPGGSFPVMRINLTGGTPLHEYTLQQRGSDTSSTWTSIATAISTDALGSGSASVFVSLLPGGGTPVNSGTWYRVIAR